MAKFQLNPGNQQGVQTYQPDRVRIGSISVFALVVIICLAVLAVLAFSTANAALTMSQRQATATTELYQDERAAQEFLAQADALLAAARQDEAARTSQAKRAADVVGAAAEGYSFTGEGDVQVVRDEYGNAVYDENGYQVLAEADSDRSRAGLRGIQAIQAQLDQLCAQAEQAADGTVSATAIVNDNKIRAEFTCENGRLLTVVLTVRNNGTYRIDRWKMSAVQNQEEPDGQLFIIDD